MAITKLPEIWEVIDSELPRDEWTPLQNIYTLIKSKIQLRPDDFLSSAPKSNPPTNEEIAHLHLRQVQVSQRALAMTCKSTRCGNYSEAPSTNSAANA